MKAILFLSTFPFLLCCHTFALEPRSDHTFQLSDGETPPGITLDDLHWLVGDWIGTILGQQFEEVWNAPTAGSMMGMYKVFDGDEVSFYEMQLITQDADGVTLKVKHFNPDFSAWEEKDEYADFPFIGFGDNAFHFAGLSFYRHDADHMEAYILLHFGEEVREEKITYQRRTP